MIIFVWYRIIRLFSTGFRALPNKIKLTFFSLLWNLAPGYF